MKGWRLFGKRARLFPHSLKNVGVVIATLLVLHTSTSASRASELVELKVVESQGIYRIRAVTLLDAPAKHVRSALNDLVHIYRISLKKRHITTP